ncbi:RAMP superfamily CRISPR-associated protein [Caldiplasma sukawensis]
MIWELECVTPFIIKSGEKFSILELLEEDNVLYRIDTSSFSAKLSRGEIDEQNKIFENFIKIKKKMTDKNKGKRDISNPEDEYLRIWNQIQNFNRKNKASEHKLFPKIEKGRDFTRAYEFDDYINIIVFREKYKEFVPYIPGSTVKGLLRRMLYLEFIKLHSKNPSVKTINLEGEKDQFIKMTEEKLKLLMQSIQVSDFYPALDYKIKIDSVKRDPKGPRTFLPLVQSGKFYGEVNLNLPKNLSPELIEILLDLGINYNNSNNRNMYEERIFNIVTENSRIIIEQNQMKYQKNYYLGETEEKSYIALGFGKGLSLSGFVSVKNMYNLKLPRIRSLKTNRYYDSAWQEQDFPKTNWMINFYVKGRNTMMKTKLGIFKVKNMGAGQMKDLKELDYILKRVEE